MPIGHGVSRFVAATGLNVIAGCEVVVESALENAWLKPKIFADRVRPSMLNEAAQCLCENLAASDVITMSSYSHKVRHGASKIVPLKQTQLIRCGGSSGNSIDIDGAVAALSDGAGAGCEKA
jgi:hypothetical protein